VETVKAIISEFGQIKNWEDFHNIDHYVDFSYNRPGEDVRYALDDSKIRDLGWEPKSVFSEEIIRIVSYYKSKFIW
jgi:dTDP-glucose 4,6-dehydratase